MGLVFILIENIFKKQIIYQTHHSHVRVEQEIFY